MSREHHYRVTTEWTGDRGRGTADYRAYGRDHVVSAGTKSAIAGSADPAFRGDGARWNPEEMLVAALSSCHMLAYLHLCATHGVVVTGYRDEAAGTMALDSSGTGRMTRVTLRPVVTIAGGETEVATRLHEQAHEACFIASSVNFPVAHEATIERVGEAT